MNIDLKKEHLTINRSVLEQTSDVQIGSDLIVPDTKPDIDRILQIDGRASVTGRDVSGGKITISGTAEFSVLYLPCDDDMPVRCIKTSINFKDVFETNCTEQNIRVCAEADVDSIDFSLINSRKLNLSAVISINVKAYKQNALQIVCDIESDEPLQIRHKTIKTYSVAADEETEITVPDKIEVPSGNYPIGEILKMDATVTGQDVKVVSGKAIIKGNVNLQTLYLAPSGDVPVQFMEHEIPFTEILDLQGVTEGMECEVLYDVGSIYFETDDDTESTVVGVEVTVNVHAQAVCTDSMSVPDDCYCTSCDVSPARSSRSIEYIAGMSQNRTTVRGNINLPEGSPGIMQLYSVVAKPFVESIDNTDGDIIIKGVMDTYLLYMTADPAIPLFSTKGEIPFEITGDIKAPDSDTAIECAVNLVNCGYTVSGDDSVDVRANIDVLLKLICHEDVSLIEDIAISEAAEDTPRASIVICFVKPGDTLWDIAKRYKTTPEKIAQLNELDTSAPLTQGMSLIIP